MTLDFAKKEAQRRTDAIGTTHYVLESNATQDEYIVTATAYKGYRVVGVFHLQQVHCDSCGRMVDRDHRCGPNNSI